MIARKIIITLGVIVIAIIGINIHANADAEAHLFKVEELEIQDEALESEAALQITQFDIIFARAKRISNEAIRRNDEANRLYTQSVETVNEAEAERLWKKAGRVEAQSKQLAKEALRIINESETYKFEANRLTTESNRLRDQAAIHRRKAKSQ